jgi:hypothetical protein
MSKTDVYDNIPLSKAEIDAEWRRSCAFEMAGKCYLPTDQAQLSSLKAMAEASRAEGIDLLDESRHADLWDAISDEGIPKDLFVAILRRLADPGADTWVAMFMLKASGGTFPRTQFVELWRDLLPKKLASSCSIDTLKVCSNFLLLPLTIRTNATSPIPPPFH